ncbi:hypothetical protein HSBAA_50650 [Vreelandella sulfidaeris]|uniref:DUF3459 domain-containing protein n=1 Tax=Vreelandella sulfidaeris TaxID=115553 RepID=A0A455UHR6_9GAMM|nr:hypothetical protein HSBAA_50650 [Halomonas sulfidaeris]
MLARWQMNDETHLVIVLNLGEHPAATLGLGVGQLLHETDEGVAKAAQSGRIPPRAAAAWLRHNPGDEEVSA